VIFQGSRCNACNHQLELPSIHFLCQHSFHQQWVMFWSTALNYIVLLYKSWSIRTVGKCYIIVRKAALEDISSRKFCTQEYYWAQIVNSWTQDIILRLRFLLYWFVMLVIVASRAMLRMKMNVPHVFRTTKRF